MWPPAYSLRGMFPRSPRRGWACPSRRISEMAVVRRRGESQTRPPPIHGNGSVRRTPTRTPCHGWSEPGAAVKWCRPKFCADQGPVARKESTPGTVFCAPEILRKGVGVSPVNGGSGGGATMGGDAHRSPPPAAFWFLFRREKRNSPKGRNPPRGTKPFRTLAGGSGDPPLQRFRRITAGRENGRGKPLPYGTVGKHSAPEDAKSTTPRRTLTKKGMAGLNYHKMYHNVPLLTSAQHGWRCFLWLAITRQIINYVNGRQTTR